MKLIIFNEKDHSISLGRNGVGINRGVWVNKSARLSADNTTTETVCLTPKTVRTEFFNGYIEFPVDAIPEIIEELNKIYSKNDH